ncbi:MAG: AMP-binding protein [Bdellovibrionia bacterium]
MNRIWQKNYPAGVPHEIQADRYASVVQLLEESCERFGERTSFTNMGVGLSYRELWKLSGHFASYLQHTLKLKKGDRIAIQMPNLLQYPVAMFGALRAGLIVVNTNPLYTPREMRHQFRDSGVKAIVILANFADKLEEVLPETQIEHIIITEIGDLFHTPKRQLVNFVIRHVKKMVPRHSLKHVSFREALEKGATLQPSTPVLQPEETAFLQYTGGTTGISKGAVLSHRNIISNMEQIAAWMKPRLEVGKETMMTPLPLYHIFSLTVNCLAFVKVGATIVLVTNPRDLPAFMKELKQSKPTAMSIVNTLASALLHHPEFKSVPFDQLKLTVAGGMALQTSVARQWSESTRTTIIEGYGLTESSPVVSCNPVDDTGKVGTIGMPLPSTDVRIMSEESPEAAAKELGVGEIGELWVKGPQVMKGYWNQPEETAKVITSDGWLKTGDIAQIDADGYIKIVDRKKDMILVSGFNVYPNEVEDVAGLHPKVRESAAVGVPDEKSGEVVKLFVVKKDPSLTAQELKQHLKSNLTGYKVPHTIEFMDDLPKNNIGKILRRELRGK